ncbi:MAG: YebC/PmpR family DNA-binding transcriptional regulator [Planctomycetes bacterium]|nr:YebC/PmpR family DNA-binding transcriptional regulator [Planctomycetota bacterium]MBM4057493.1 YebC/PmpR family DNA-binding transcriptional regulator [Planctomycetota bacterium]MBU6277170.1 YebC/PmpR family DNA-binding transcriptional regulator [Planctomycetota bacterium]
MAGHSHWANIARKKSLIDAKRGKLWSKLAKAIIVAAKHGGADPDANLRLRYAIDAAKAVSMPKDNIQRAIRTGTGELKGGNLEESIYEGYAAGGVAVLCEILTDNKNRTAPEIRKIFEMCDGKLGATGCVAYLFQRKGVVRVAQGAVTEERLVELTLDAGADDVKLAGDRWEITCEPAAITGVLDALRAAGLEPEPGGIVRLPTTTVSVDDVDVARKVLALLERLDDHDDVQSVAANFSIPDEALAQLG